MITILKGKKFRSRPQICSLEAPLQIKFHVDCILLQKESRWSDFTGHHWFLIEKCLLRVQFKYDLTLSLTLNPTKALYKTVYP